MPSTNNLDCDIPSYDNGQTWLVDVKVSELPACSFFVIIVPKRAYNNNDNNPTTHMINIMS